jgi:hypothetical protein
MSVEENKERLDRHERVIEKLIDQVAKLQIANNIQNFINEANSKGKEEDLSDTSLRP